MKRTPNMNALPFYRMALIQIKHVFALRHSRGFGIHSPYIFHLINDILYNTYPYYNFEAIESKPPVLKADKKSIKTGRLLFKLGTDLNALNIAYFGNNTDPEWYYLNQLKQANSRIVIHDTTLSFLNNTNKASAIDLVVFGNQIDESFMEKAFEKSLTLKQNHSIFVFTGTPAKNKPGTWKKIKKHPAVQVTLDLYTIGLVFFRPDLQRKQYLLHKF
jgi:hypothetical protein